MSVKNDSLKMIVLKTLMSVKNSSYNLTSVIIMRFVFIVDIVVVNSLSSLPMITSCSQATKQQYSEFLFKTIYSDPEQLKNQTKIFHCPTSLGASK